jgi:AcrR family transcriptional regulator
VARTQEQRKAETRARLLVAAADLFAQRGFDGVSAEAIADAADRTTGALYSHFGGKEGLLLSLLEERQQAIGEQIVDRVRDAGTLDDRLRALWTRSGDDEHAGSWSLLEVELLLLGARDRAIAELVAERLASTRAQLGRTLAAWTDDGAADTERAAHLVIALLLGLSLMQRVEPGAAGTADVVRALRALVLET